MRLLLLAGLLLLLPSSQAIEIKHDEQLIGWKGDTYRPEQSERDDFWIEPISWTPRAFIFHNFISDAEANHIAEQAWPKMQRSSVVGTNGSAVLDDYRTSYGTFLGRYHDEIIATVQRRVAIHTRAPVVNQEDMQVLRYGIGQYYHKHTDSLDGDSPRMATLLIYLADPEIGGETAFPDGSVWASKAQEERYSKGMSDCAQGHVAFRPRRGDGLLFWSIKPDGKTEDMHSMHEGCPVVKGAKWTATVWVHNAPFRPEQYKADKDKFTQGPDEAEDPGWCQEERPEQCASWAKAGECKKNVEYMKGHCPAACSYCAACKPNNITCYNENRRKLGFLVFNREELDFNRAATSA